MLFLGMRSIFLGVRSVPIRARTVHFALEHAQLRDELRPRVRDGARRLDQLLRGLQAHALLLHLAEVNLFHRFSSNVRQNHSFSFITLYTMYMAI